MGRTSGLSKRYLVYKIIELNKRFRNQRDSGSRLGVTKLYISGSRGTGET